MSVRKALIALHFQNDICHPDGVVPFAVDRASGDGQRFLDTSSAIIARARAADWLIVHVHIAFAPDYSDLPRNCWLFRAVEPLGALKRGSWGAEPMDGFDPETGDIVIVHRANNAFHGTGLEGTLRVSAIGEVAVMGLATQYSVEHTVRHAADLGYAVTMIRDCCASADPAAAEASFKAMAMLAEVKTSEEIAFSQLGIVSND
jgi:nicotinamidase-related amidase